MLETGFAQLRFAASLLFGTRFSLRSLDQLIASLQATQREFGFIRSEGREMLASPQLDEETRRTIQLRRFRSQAVRAARETDYYQRLFERLDLDPARLRYEEIVKVPCTSKADLRRDPEAFVRRTARPFLRAMTTGTTGWPTSVSFSAYELQVYAALTAISALFSAEMTSSTVSPLVGAFQGLTFKQGCQCIGALPVSHYIQLVEGDGLIASVMQVSRDGQAHLTAAFSLRIILLVQRSRAYGSVVFLFVRQPTH